MEIQILDFIQQHFRSAPLDAIMKVITSLSNSGLIWIALTLVLICFKRTRIAGLTMALALVLGVIVGNLTIKPIVARPRPFVVNPAAELIIPPPSEYSFPSGHTLSSFCSATALCLRHRMAGIAALVFAAVIGFSRLYMYVHFPTDVLAGMVLGILLAFAAKKILDAVITKYRNKHSSQNQ